MTGGMWLDLLLIGLIRFDLNQLKLLHGITQSLNATDVFMAVNIVKVVADVV